MEILDLGILQLIGLYGMRSPLSVLLYQIHQPLVLMFLTLFTHTRLYTQAHKGTPLPLDPFQRL